MVFIHINDILKQFRGYKAFWNYLNKLEKKVEKELQSNQHLSSYS